MRSFLLALALAAPLGAMAAPLGAQTAPNTFHLVLPHHKGAVFIDTSGWKIERVYLSDNGKRPILFMTNASTGVDASYMLEYDPPYYTTSEACRNDTLGSVFAGPLAKARVVDKHNDNRQLQNGQNLAIGSFLIKKEDGLEINQQNVWGFYATDNTCATFHLSKASFIPADTALFDPIILGFTYQPDYSPTPADYSSMASLLPPDMAASYKTAAAGGTPSPLPTPATLDLGQSLTFALPDHPGYLHLDAPAYIISELSAKPNGHEFGIRAHDTSISHTEILGFLFMPEPKTPTAAACRDWIVKLEKSQGDGFQKKISFYNQSLHEIKSDSGVDIALIEYKQSREPDSFVISRAFVASGDLCADIKMTGAGEIFIRDAQSILRNLKFDPDRPPDFNAKFRFASVLYFNKNYAAAASFFVEALALVDTTDDPLKWRRVTTDQASMAYGISGDLAKSRAMNEAAIAKDADYPLYYYNLACADAESGDAGAAQKHLQEAFDRRANTLPGEKLPDPATDDSILKLKKDTAFWAFVEALPKS
jgi:tetratricopeptide (TPR) repeat protein